MAEHAHLSWRSPITRLVVSETMVKRPPTLPSSMNRGL
jgi:hypothetical protein